MVDTVGRKQMRDHLTRRENTRKGVSEWGSEAER
jgi:hypothetical protein